MQQQLLGIWDRTWALCCGAALVGTAMVTTYHHITRDPASTDIAAAHLSCVSCLQYWSLLAATPRRAPSGLHSQDHRTRPATAASASLCREEDCECECNQVSERGR